MKLIIDITKADLELCPQYIQGDIVLSRIVGAVANGTPISDNATNGDVIKAMFPTADISLNDSCFEGVVNKYGFDMKWWNAKYKAESEDKG